MIRKEYLIQQYLKYLNSLTKEDVISSFKPVIEQLSKEALEKLIEMNNADIIPYHVAIKNELVEQLMAMNIVEVDAYISDDDWGDSIYNEELDDSLVEFFTNVIRLISYCYKNEQKPLAFQLVKKLYSIDFVCAYNDEESDYSEEKNDEEVRYIKNYYIDHFDSELGFIIKHEKIEDIYVEAAIITKDIKTLIDLLLNKYNTYDFIDMIRQQDSSLLYFMGERIIEENLDCRGTRDIFYLFDVINDYCLYLKAVEVFFKKAPKVLTRFINAFYDEQNDNHNTEIENIVSKKIMTIDKDDELFHQYIYEPVIMDILYMFPKEEYILKYYSLFEGDKAFIVFNSLKDELFFRHIRKNDKKWLYITSDLLDNGYENNKYILRAIFKKDEDDAILKQGQINYLKRAKYNKKRILSDLIEYVKKIGRNYNSKSYYRYRDFVNEIEKDINHEVDLIKIVKEAYPTRPKLQEIF